MLVREEIVKSGLFAGRHWRIIAVDDYFRIERLYQWGWGCYDNSFDNLSLAEANRKLDMIIEPF